MLEAILCKLSSVCHLGNCLGTYKGCYLDLVHTGVYQCVDDADLFLKCEHLLEVLPTVSRSDFNDLNFFHFNTPSF